MSEDDEMASLPERLRRAAPFMRGAGMAGIVGQHANTCEEAALRVEELEAAIWKAHGLLSSLSMGVDGHLRKQVCTASNILGKPLGRSRSSHGDPEQE